MQSLYNGRVSGCLSVSPSSVCPVDRPLPLVAAWARAADIDRQLQAPELRLPGGVMLRAEVRGSQQRLVLTYR